MKVEKIIQTLADAREGMARTVGLLDDPKFCASWKDLIGKYSNLPADLTAVWEGTTGDFLVLKSELFTEDEADADLFLAGLQRIIWAALQRKSASVIRMYGLYEDWHRGSKLVTIFFGITSKQARKLTEWEAHQRVAERNLQLQQHRTIVDPELELEMERTGGGTNADD